MVAEPVVLEKWECESLLRSQVVGRVGFVGPDGPYVLPVNYSVVGGDLVLRTDPSSLLGRFGPGGTVALEVDHLDHARHRGWSVLARGPAETLEDAERIAYVERVWPPRPWADGSRSLYLVVRRQELTGRRLGTGWDLRRDLPVNRTV